MFTELVGKRARIVPMERKHIQGLYEAGKDLQVWSHLSKEIHTVEEMATLVEEALLKKANREEMPFVILDRETNKVVGSTRFLALSEATKSLEIGWTWYNPSVWGTDFNTECKYLLLRYCFETLGLIRVQFKTDNQNIRSQKAIEKIGGIKEGVLRNHMIRKDGTYRDSVFFSIINSDWEGVKEKLEARLTSSQDSSQ